MRILAKVGLTYILALQWRIFEKRWNSLAKYILTEWPSAVSLQSNRRHHFGCLKDMVLLVSSPLLNSRA